MNSVLMKSNKVLYVVGVEVIRKTSDRISHECIGFHERQVGFDGDRLVSGECYSGSPSR